MRSLMDGMGKYLPAPSEIEEIARVADTGEPVELVQSETETTAAVVFKTIADLMSVRCRCSEFIPVR